MADDFNEFFRNVENNFISTHEQNFPDLTNLKIFSQSKLDPNTIVDIPPI